LLCHWIWKYPDSLSTHYWISFTLTFSTLESGFKNTRIHCQICQMQKEKVAYSKISGYVGGAQYNICFLNHRTYYNSVSTCNFVWQITLCRCWKYHYFAMFGKISWILLKLKVYFWQSGKWPIKENNRHMCMIYD